MRRWLLVSVVLATACARVEPVVVAPATNVQPRLAVADALLRTGCFECLEDALQAYEAVRARPNLPAASGDAATIGSIRAALLLELRERELGTTDDGYLQRARTLLMARDDLRQMFQTSIDDIEMTSWRVARNDTGPADAAVRRRFQELVKNPQPAADDRRARADADALSAYGWIAFACTVGDRAGRQRAALLAPLERWRDAPIVSYRIATCASAERAPLTDLLDHEPRFHEINFWLGAASIAALRLDAAESQLTNAYEWRAKWPALTALLANVYVTAEELETALTFYERTLAFAPDHADALIGRVRTLSLLGRYTESFSAIDEILKQPTRAFPGEVYYWRAWNNVQAGRLDEAWSDIEQAARLWVNSEVAKLSGVIAYRRRELAVSLARFEEARRINAGDCETQQYLGTIHAEQSEWAPTAAEYSSAAACLEGARVALRKEIDRIQSSTIAADRRARQIATREAQLDSAGRMLSTAWFNIAAASFNLGRAEDARRFAEKLTSDDRFGDRARALLRRLRP
jgi:tetratricopeptide (TPR) repeat protein